MWLRVRKNSPIALKTEAQLWVFDIMGCTENRVEVDVQRSLLLIILVILWLPQRFFVSLHIKLNWVEQCRWLEPPINVQWSASEDFRSVQTLFRWTSCQVIYFVTKKVSLLLFHPIIMPKPSLNFLRLHLKILVKPIESLFLKVDLSLSSCVAHLFILLQFELVKLRMLWQCGEHF